MKPTILKVFSTYPKKDNILFNVKKNDEANSIIRISNLDSDNIMSDITGDGFSDEFSLCNFDESDISKDWNVLEDFNKFQQRRNAQLDDKKTVSSGAQNIQRSTVERPNYSYTQLIYMAVESSVNKALTVNDIYTFCEQNFPFYANAVHGWKNSLRHNLSINKCFKKITKLGVGGRGSLWTVDPRERQHLVSTMYRSNITSFQPSLIVQRCFPQAQQVIVSEEEKCDSLFNIVEKMRQEWTDTRLCAHSEDLFDFDHCSVTSDTDHNDWQRSVTCMESLYPIKTHWLDHVNHVTPVTSNDHDYCVSDINTVLNNPSSVMRHTFLSSANNLESFSTSSDFNDEDWPRTPSPMSVQPLDRLHTPFLVSSNYLEPLQALPITLAPELTLTATRKRGRPRKDVATVAKSLKESPTVIPTHLTTVPQSRDSQIERINNMYNLNNFFNSL